MSRILEFSALHLRVWAKVSTPQIDQIYDTATAIYLRSDMTRVKVTGNTLDGGRIRIGTNVVVDQSGNTVGCFEGIPASNG